MLSWFAPLLPVGSPAPPFRLPDERGREVTLDEFDNRAVVLVFYPGDDTPVCRRQLCEFRDNWGVLEARGVAVLGVNPRGAASHARFREKSGFPFPLLVDAGQKAARLYHASGPFVRRTVYLIGPGSGPGRRILFARRGKPAPGEVLAALEV
ncbi:MAG: peroxiredoxin [Acidobacteria bacterium]|nr:peroxiredoxin [Acidobacteriota bacterium]